MASHSCCNTDTLIDKLERVTGAGEDCSTSFTMLQLVSARIFSLISISVCMFLGFRCELYFPENSTCRRNMSPMHERDRLIAPKQARLPTGQPVTAKTTCISSSSLQGLRQDISASLPNSYDQEGQPYHRYFPKVSMLSRSTALKPIAIKNAASTDNANDRAPYDRIASSLASSTSSRQSENASDCPEKLLFARDENLDEGRRSTRKSRFRFRKPPSSKTSRSPDYRGELLAEEHVSEHLIASLDLAAQEPPPDLSSSVVSTWTHIYEHQAADLQAHAEFANHVIDELDKSFTPTLDLHDNDEETISKGERSEHGSDATSPAREPEWF